MLRNAIIYLSTFVVLLPLDVVFLGLVGKKLFKSEVGDMVLESPRLPPAVLFYVLYLAGVVVFVNGAVPGDWTKNLLYGALFGLFCYSTFELTNMALLKHWEWSVVVVDIAWGTILTALAASLGGLLANAVLARL